MKFILSVIVTSSIILFSGCCKKVVTNENVATENTVECAAACAKIIPSESATQISALDIENGQYYGSLSQKKKGTPDNWLHVLEGTKSAAWCSPTAAGNYSSGCDCKK